jgi:hypothetical protein
MNSRRNICHRTGVESTMKMFAAVLVLAFVLSGCATDSKKKAEAQQNFLAGQNAELRQQVQPIPTVTIIGSVRNPRVPWVEGLTLAQAIATANYLDTRQPETIIITRNGESATLDSAVLLKGTTVPLEAGDVVEIQP